MSTDSLLSTIARLSPAQARALGRLHLFTVRDLLFHFPSRYTQEGEERQIAGVTVGETVTLYGRIKKTEARKAWKRKIPMAEATLEDGSGTIKIIWFRQAYMAKIAPEGSLVKVSGKVAERAGKTYIANPSIERVEALPQSLFTPTSIGETPGFQPVYPETKGITSGWFRHRISTLIAEKLHEQIEDPLPHEVLERYHLPSLTTALVWLHAPQKERDAEAARKRFAFEEIFFIQLKRLKDRAQYATESAYTIAPDKKELSDFVSRFPFSPTLAQKKAITAILADMKAPHPMTRLLEGDVGSGKTAVAAVSAYAAVRAGYEIAYMAPTEILARQHFESFIKYFSHLGVQVGLITGSECRKFPSKINAGEHTHISRAQLLKWVANGEIPILVGTHALIQKSVEWKALALAIIDEQHRFGVKQRMALVKKGNRAPHLLSMTATPIPRTLALTLYGDLDLTLLDELPVGRKRVITEMVPEDARGKTYAQVRKELEEGRQCFVICPRIDEPDPEKELALQVKSAKAEAKRLQIEVFPDYDVGLIHSKLSSAEKDKVMQEFLAGTIHILVSTSVVEVGVNVPNATVMVIEGAERFGLAQLHQLRGRVARSNDQAYCYLFTSKKKTASVGRLKALVTAKNGFELAEEDLKLRGAGSLTGSQQSGLSDLAMEALKNLKLVEAARSEAASIIASDPTLSSHPLLHNRLTHTDTHHFE